ncbi:MAG: TIGR04086 family membrane protein [Bacilli bacterium]|nr:TIGR04086 family membrane protein [Bacilli bacterium]
MKYLKMILTIFGVIILVSFITSNLSYFNLIKENTKDFINTFSILLIIFIVCFINGKKINNKGYLEGIKIGLIIDLIFIIIRLLLKKKITLYKLLFYIIVLLISIFGSITGINKKKNKS